MDMDGYEVRLPDFPCDPKRSRKEKERLVENHNKLAPAVTIGILSATKKAGGTGADVLIVLESIVAGCILNIAKSGKAEEVLADFFQGCNERIREVTERISEDAKASSKGSA